MKNIKHNTKTPNTSAGKRLWRFLSRMLSSREMNETESTAASFRSTEEETDRRRHAVLNWKTPMERQRLGHRSVVSVDPSSEFAQEQSQEPSSTTIATEADLQSIATAVDTDMSKSIQQLSQETIEPLTDEGNRKRIQTIVEEKIGTLSKEQKRKLVANLWKVVGLYLQMSHKDFTLFPSEYAQVQRIRTIQADFRRKGIPTRVDLVYHHTSSKNLESIQTHGLLSKRERRQKNIRSEDHGSSHGDGIYCSEDPCRYACERYGDTTILLARLKGIEQVELRGLRSTTGRPGWRFQKTFHTLTVQEGFKGEFSVLQSSDLCLPLFWFPSKKLYGETTIKSNSKFLDQEYMFRRRLANFHQKVQHLVCDLNFNQRDSPIIPTPIDNPFVLAYQKDPDLNQLKCAEEAQQEAESKFLTGNLEASLDGYNAALRHMFPDPDQVSTQTIPSCSASVKGLLLEIYTKLGAIHSQTNDWEKTLEACDMAIATQPPLASLETLVLRKANALANLERHTDAIRCLQEAHKRMPNSKAIKLGLPRQFRRALQANAVQPPLVFLPPVQMDEANVGVV